MMLFIKCLYGNNIIAFTSPDSCTQKDIGTVAKCGEERKKSV